MKRLAGCILAWNEEDFIEGCLKHHRILEYIIVLDNYSTDDTYNIAKNYADEVIQHKFSGSFAYEKNLIQSKVPDEYEIVCHIDADEKFPRKSLRSIPMTWEQLDPPPDCVRFNRWNMPKGEDYPDPQVRCFEKNKVEWRRHVHEIPYSIEHDRPVDQCSIVITSKFDIIHLEKPPEVRRKIRERWDKIEFQHTDEFPYLTSNENTRCVKCDKVIIQNIMKYKYKFGKWYCGQCFKKVFG